MCLCVKGRLDLCRYWDGFRMDLRDIKLGVDVREILVTNLSSQRNIQHGFIEIYPLNIFIMEIIIIIFQMKYPILYVNGIIFRTIVAL